MWCIFSFSGDVELKAIIQWIAASQCNRMLRYYTFGRDGIDELLQSLVSLCAETNKTVGDLLKVLFDVCTNLSNQQQDGGGRIRNSGLLSVLIKALGGKTPDKPLESKPQTNTEGKTEPLGSPF